MDMSINLFKKSKTDTEEISAQEGFNIWDVLRSRYNSAETICFFSNFVHDRDFDMMLDDHLQNIRDQIAKLESMAGGYKVKVPSAPNLEFSISAELDQVTDSFIFRKIFLNLQSELLFMAHRITSSTFNDEVRNTLVKFTLSHVNDFESFYKYGKLKGWAEIPPAYKTYKPEQGEQLSSNEAAHIWDHLSLRYDQKQVNEIFSRYVHDPEFDKILDRGRKVLKDQIKVLEQKAAEFEVPVTEKHPVVHTAGVDPEVVEDRFVYRRILKGIQESIEVHVRAVVDTVRNDNLRSLFFDFLKEELDLYNAFLKYGKVKGWTHIVPKQKV